MRGVRAYVIVSAAAIGFALGYALPVFARLVNLIYHPVERRFFWADTPGPVAMGYYGQVLYGVAGLLLCSTIALAVTARRTPGEATLKLLGAWALTLLGLVAAYFCWANWP